MENWLCFRGRHTIHLEPRAYAVVAQAEDDPERSNWQGKTAFVEAMRFALYGEHRHRLENGWITRGEKGGSVTLTFDTGFLVERKRQRGESTQLTAINAAGTMATGPMAQKLIDQVLGVGARDFMATAYFAQRDTARLVTVPAGKRMEVVGEWLRLAPVLAAEEHNAAKLRAAADAADRLRASIAAHKDAEVRELAGSTHEAITNEAHVLRNERSASRTEQESLELALRAVDAFDRVRDLRGEYERLVEEGKALAESIGSAFDPHEAELQRLEAEQAVRTANSRHAVVLALYEQRAELARGEFSGTCPVAGIACPAKDAINASTKANALLLEESQDFLCAAREDYGKKEEKYRAVAGEINRHAGLVGLRERATSLREQIKAAKGEWRDPCVSREELQRQWREERDRGDAKARELHVLLARVERAVAAAMQRDKLEVELEGVERSLGTLREAAQVLGRNGVRRRIAEPFLRQLEAGANEALAACGVQLSVKVLWEHEGEDRAKACALCGHPFPDTAKAKQCARCQAPRGKNIVNRLEFELSDQSTAAEDLAGITLQLAARSWLMQDRGSALELVVLDEPLAHCDRAHRRQLTRAFVAMLAGRFGARQAFVISHSPDTQGAFPGTLRIIGGPQGSHVEVR